MNTKKYNTRTVSYLHTFDGEIYRIDDKTPDDIYETIREQDFIRMQDGTYINRKTIKTIQSRENFFFQEDARMRKKQGQFLRDGKWYDAEGFVAEALPQGEVPVVLQERVNK